MPAIIRLSRHGKKGQAFYHIVVADSRFARDARFIEKIGTYNPRTNPVTVDIKFDRAIDWIQKGAKPSDTMRSILSQKGVLYRAHLQRGVAKGVLTQEQADAKFTKWVSEKDVKVSDIKSSSQASRKDAYTKRMAIETTARESRSAKRKAKEDTIAAAAVPAENATVKAEKPSITGENAKVTGENATVTRENATVTGENATVTGENATVTGENATVTGENAKVAGENA